MPQFETGSKKLSISSIVAPQQTRVTTADDVNNLLGTVAKTTDDMVKVIDNEVMTDKSRRYNEARANYQRGLESANGDPFATNEVWGKFKAETQSLIDEGGFINQESQNKLQGTIINEISQRELYHNNMNRQYQLARFQDGMAERLAAFGSNNIGEFLASEKAIAPSYNITDMNSVTEAVVGAIKNKMTIELSSNPNMDKALLDGYSQQLTELTKLDPKLMGKDYYVKALNTVEAFKNEYNKTQLEVVKANLTAGTYNGNSKAFERDIAELSISDATKEAMRVGQQAKQKDFYTTEINKDISAIMHDPKGIDKLESLKLKMKQAGYSKDQQESYINILTAKADKGDNKEAEQILKMQYNSLTLGLSQGVPVDPATIENYHQKLGKPADTFVDANGKETQHYIGVSKEEQEAFATSTKMWELHNNPSAFFTTSIDTLPKYMHAPIKAYAENQIMSLYNSNNPNRMGLIASINKNYGTTTVLQDNYTRALQDPAQFDKAYAEVKELRVALPNTYKDVVGEKTAGVFELANTIKTLDGEKTINSRIMKEAEQKYSEPIYFEDKQKRKMADAVVKEGIVSSKRLNEDVTGAMKIGKSFDEALDFAIEQQKQRVVGFTDLSALKVDLKSEEKELIKSGEQYHVAVAGEVIRGIRYDDISKTMKVLYKNGGAYDTRMSYDEYKEWIRAKQLQGEQVD